MRVEPPGGLDPVELVRDVELGHEIEGELIGAVYEVEGAFEGDTAEVEMEKGTFLNS